MSSSVPLSDASVRAEVRDFILQDLLAGVDPSELEDDMRLVGGTVLNSIDTIKLVGFIEDRYRIKLDVSEVVGGGLETVSTIVAAVLAKTAVRRER